MSKGTLKAVLILDETLPKGIAANTAAILGMSMGSSFLQLVGPEKSWTETAPDMRESA